MKILLCLITSLMLMFTFSSCLNKKNSNDNKLNSTTNFKLKNLKSPKINAEKNNAKKSKKTVIVGISEYKPFEFYDSNKEVVGLSADIVKFAFKKMGYKLIIKNRPFNRLMEELKSGIGVDAVFSCVKTPVREKFAYFSSMPIAEGQKSFFALANSHISYTGNLKDLEGKIIGIENSYSYGAKFDLFAKHDNANIDFSNNIDQGIRKLIAGKISLFAAEDTNFLVKAKELKVLDKIKKLDYPLVKTKYYIMFSKEKNLRPVCENFDNTLADMQDNGIFDVIKLKYLNYFKNY